MNKSSVRRSVLSLRQSMDEAFIIKASMSICEKFEELYGDLNVFLLYLPIKCEVDTRYIVDKLYKMGKSVYLPCVLEDALCFKRFEGFDSVHVGRFGVHEATGCAIIEQADAIVVPAVAYDEKRNRLGYGKGYYDRFLPSVKNVAKVGFAFDFQIVENVYAESFDEPVDVIITEKRNINGRSAKNAD